MLDSERTIKIKERLAWTVFEILFTSAIMGIKRVLHRNEIVQSLQNCKRQEFHQSHSRKLLKSSTLLFTLLLLSYIQIENTKTTRLLL